MQPRLDAFAVRFVGAQSIAEHQWLCGIGRVANSCDEYSFNSLSVS